MRGDSSTPCPRAGPAPQLSLGRALAFLASNPPSPPAAPGGARGATGAADPWQKVLIELVGWINDPLELSLSSLWGNAGAGGREWGGILSCLTLLQCTGWSWGIVWVLKETPPLEESPGIDSVTNRAAGIWESCDTQCPQPLGAVSFALSSL